MVVDQAVVWEPATQLGEGPRTGARQRASYRIGVRLAQIVVLAVLVFPIGFAVLTALEPTAASLSGKVTLNFTPTLSNFSAVFSQGGLARPLLNSALSSGLSALVATIVGVPAAYALARVQVKGYWLVRAALFASRGLPAIGVAIPFFVIFTDIHLIDTIWALAIVYLPFNVALVVWLMTQYFVAVPADLDEAAALDGCGHLATLWRVILPVSRPGLVSTVMMTFVYGWNNFIYPLLLTNRNAVTASVSITSFVGEYVVNWGEIMAGVVVLSAPMLVLGYVLRRYMVSGLTQGSIR